MKSHLHLSSILSMSSYLSNPSLCSLGEGTAYEVLDPWVRWDKRPGTARIVALRRRVIESSSYYVLPIVLHVNVVLGRLDKNGKKRTIVVKKQSWSWHLFTKNHTREVSETRRYKT